MAVIYKCATCQAKIRSETGLAPDICLRCGAQVASTRSDDDVVMPFIRSQSTKNNDKLYRDIEAGSEVRAQIAADHLGVPVSEMSDMKITNMNDRRDAEIAAMPVSNDITKHMAATGHDPWAAAAGQGAQFAAGTAQGIVTHGDKIVGTGVAPRAGAHASAGLQKLMGR